MAPSVKGLHHGLGTRQEHDRSWEIMGVDISVAETVYVTSRHQTDGKHSLRNAEEGDVIVITRASNIQQCDGFVK